jgi:hypothetical protein
MNIQKSPFMMAGNNALGAHSGIDSRGARRHLSQSGRASIL